MPSHFDICQRVVFLGQSFSFRFFQDFPYRFPEYLHQFEVNQSSFSSNWQHQFCHFVNLCSFVQRLEEILINVLVCICKLVLYNKHLVVFLRQCLFLLLLILLLQPNLGIISFLGSLLSELFACYTYYICYTYLSDMDLVKIASSSVAVHSCF